VLTCLAWTGFGHRVRGRGPKRINGIARTSASIHGLERSELERWYPVRSPLDVLAMLLVAFNPAAGGHFFRRSRRLASNGPHNECTRRRSLVQLRRLAGGSGGVSMSTVSCKEKLTWQQVSKLPRPGLQSVSNVKFTPDSKHVLYLKSDEYGSLSLQLYVTDVSTGETHPVACTPPGGGEEEELSLEEKLRRERARIMNTGLTSFKVAGAEGSQGRVLVPMGGALYVREGIGEDSSLSRLFDPAAAPLGPGPVLDPQISDDGSLVCFVWSDELYCVPADGSAPPRALTKGARGTGVTHGLADYLAQEELNRYEGFWMSADGSKVAYEAVDESHIFEYRIMHQGDPSIGGNAQEDHRYPFAGEQNPKVRLFVVSATEGDSEEVPTPVEFNLTGPFGPDFYLARVRWLPDGALIVQVLSRDQERCELLRCDPATGEVKSLFSEHTPTWVNAHEILEPIGKSGKFLWASECKSGFRHLYIYDPATEETLQPLTEGNWLVDDLVAVDEEADMVYFTGTSEGQWLERHLFKVPLSSRTSKPQQVTSVPGFHTAVIDRKRTCFVDIVHSTEQPAVVTLRSLSDGHELHTIYKNEDPLISELSVEPPEFVTFPSTDGKVTLQGAVYKPDPKVWGSGPYPAMVSCYGGPHVQFVQNSWLMTMDLRAQALVSRGFLVIKVDNRGSNRRGLDFEAPIKHKMGSVEVDDQVAAVKYCVNEGLCDASKVGIYGWSYGGYLSAMCLARASDVFKCAVSGAPVTSWDGYDTCYTERYMGTPQSNPDGYKSSSVMEHVSGMSGDLLLVHGLIDENVHFRHTARLINSLIAEQKVYQLLLFPNERHSPRSQKDREYMEEQIFSFIDKSLRKS